MDLGQLDVAAEAVAGADVARLDHPNLVLGDLQRLRQAGANTVSPLVRVVHDQFVVVPPRDRVRKLEREVIFERLAGDYVDGYFAPGVVWIAAHQRRRNTQDEAIQLRVELMRGGRLHRLQKTARSWQDPVLRRDQAHRL